MLGWDREPVIVPSEGACGSGNGRLGNRDAGEARTPGQTARPPPRQIMGQPYARLGRSGSIDSVPFPASRQSSARSIPPAKSGLRRGGIDDLERTFSGRIEGNDGGIILEANATVTFQQREGELSGSWTVNGFLSYGGDDIPVRANASLTGTVAEGRNPKVTITLKHQQCSNSIAVLTGTHTTEGSKISATGTFNLLDGLDGLEASPHRFEVFPHGPEFFAAQVLDRVEDLFPADPCRGRYAHRVPPSSAACDPRDRCLRRIRIVGIRFGNHSVAAFVAASLRIGQIHRFHSRRFGSGGDAALIDPSPVAASRDVKVTVLTGLVAGSIMIPPSG